MLVVLCQGFEGRISKPKCLLFIDWLNKYLLVYLPTDKALVEKLRVVGSELEGDVVQYTCLLSTSSLVRFPAVNIKMKWMADRCFPQAWEPPPHGKYYSDHSLGQIKKQVAVNFN